MVASGAVALGWTLAGTLAGGGGPWLGIEPIFPALVASAAALWPAWAPARRRRS